MATPIKRTIITTNGLTEVFNTYSPLTSFSIVNIPVGTKYTLCTAIDLSGSYVNDPIYVNYTVPSQDLIYNAGRFGIIISNLPAGQSITVEYKSL